MSDNPAWGLQWRGPDGKISPLLVSTTRAKADELAEFVVSEYAAISDFVPEFVFVLMAGCAVEPGYIAIIEDDPTEGN